MCVAVPDEGAQKRFGQLFQVRKGARVCVRASDYVCSCVRASTSRGCACVYVCVRPPVHPSGTGPLITMLDADARHSGRG